MYGKMNRIRARRDESTEWKKEIQNHIPFSSDTIAGRGSTKIEFGIVESTIEEYGGSNLVAKLENRDHTNHVHTIHVEIDPDIRIYRVCCPGSKVPVRAEPKVKSDLLRYIYSGDEIEVKVKVVAGFFELTKNKGFVNRSTKGVEFLDVTPVAPTIVNPSVVEAETLQGYQAKPSSTFKVAPSKEPVLTTEEVAAASAVLNQPWIDTIGPESTPPPPSDDDDSDSDSSTNSAMMAVSSGEGLDSEGILPPAASSASVGADVTVEALMISAAQELADPSALETQDIQRELVSNQRNILDAFHFTASEPEPEPEYERGDDDEIPASASSPDHASTGAEKSDAREKSSPPATEGQGTAHEVSSEPLQLVVPQSSLEPAPLPVPSALLESFPLPLSVPPVHVPAIPTLSFASQPVTAVNTVSGQDVQSPRSAANVSRRPIRSFRRATVRVNVAVVGRAGSGKTTFLQQLLEPYVQGVAEFLASANNSTDLAAHAASMLAQGPTSSSGKQVALTSQGNFSASTESGNKLDIHALESVGYGDALDNSASVASLRALLLAGHNQRISLQPQLMTEQEYLAADGRVHCIFYLLDSHRLRALDEQFFAALAPLVPIVPIIAKADAMTERERAAYVGTVRAVLSRVSEQLGVCCVHDFTQSSYLSSQSATPVVSPVQTARGASGHSGKVEVEQGEAPLSVAPVNIFATICDDCSTDSVYNWGTVPAGQRRPSDLTRLREFLFESEAHLKNLVDSTQLKSIALYRASHPPGPSSSSTRASVSDHSNGKIPAVVTISAATLVSEAASSVHHDTQSAQKQSSQLAQSDLQSDYSNSSSHTTGVPAAAISLPPADSGRWSEAAPASPSVAVAAKRSTSTSQVVGAAKQLLHAAPRSVSAATMSPAAAGVRGAEHSPADGRKRREECACM